jgi:hypothetical protein
MPSSGQAGTSIQMSHIEDKIVDYLTTLSNYDCGRKGIPLNIYQKYLPQELIKKVENVIFSR